MSRSPLEKNPNTVEGFMSHMRELQIKNGRWEKNAAFEEAKRNFDGANPVESAAIFVKGFVVALKDPLTREAEYLTAIRLPGKIIGFNKWIEKGAEIVDSESGQLKEWFREGALQLTVLNGMSLEQCFEKVGQEMESANLGNKIREFIELSKQGLNIAAQFTCFADANLSKSEEQKTENPAASTKISPRKSEPLRQRTGYKFVE